jgi:hypothetical protein
MLSAPAVHELKLQETCLALMQEFLSGYFDGNAHDVGGNAAVVFPSVELRFQQAAHSQPLNGVGISLVWVAASRKWRCWDLVDGARQHMIYAKCNWTFWVRAAGQATGKGNADKQVTTASDLLVGLLENAAAVKPLAQKGIRRPRPGTPQAVQDTNYSLRMIPCGVTLRYPVLSQI